MSNAYRKTAVPVSRSQDQIRKLLINFGVSGVQFSENFESGEINVRFAKMVAGNPRTVSVSMHIPEPQPMRRRTTRGKSNSANDRREQMAKATYRALHDWLKAQFVAVEFGLLTFEDVFLSHFEWMIEGQRTTVGKILIPRLETRPEFLLTAGDA